jgi:hypothetical protein
MRALLEIILLGLIVATAGFLSIYWAWQELAEWWDARIQRRARQRFKSNGKRV